MFGPSIWHLIPGMILVALVLALHPLWWKK